jgi:hypothetical protein
MSPPDEWRDPGPVSSPSAPAAADGGKEAGAPGDGGFRAGAKTGAHLGTDAPHESPHSGEQPGGLRTDETGSHGAPSAAPAAPPTGTVDMDRGLLADPIAHRPTLHGPTGPVTSRPGPGVQWRSELPTSALARAAWAPTGQLAIPRTRSSHEAIPRHLDPPTEAGSGTVGATSGSAVGPSGGASSGPTLALLFALALVAAGCWSRLVLLLRRYCACVFLSLPERPG